MILFPSPKAIPLIEAVTQAEGRIPLVFVLDGTWRTARRILAMSHNLRALPRVSFVSSRCSRFRFKKQPEEHCLSTIEAVDECIAILEPENVERIRLMQAFDTFVERQLSFIRGQLGDTNVGSTQIKLSSKADEGDDQVDDFDADEGGDNTS